MVLALGAVLDQPWITALGFVWLAHSGFDRMLGYGLKLPEAFGHTHLGGSVARTEPGTKILEQGF